jgi:hypothetical protein
MGAARSLLLSCTHSSWLLVLLHPSLQAACGVQVQLQGM